jgi:hypothetical protein
MAYQSGDHAWEHQIALDCIAPPDMEASRMRCLVITDKLFQAGISVNDLERTYALAHDLLQNAKVRSSSDGRFTSRLDNNEAVSTLKDLTAALGRNCSQDPHVGCPFNDQYLAMSDDLVCVDGVDRSKRLKN